MGINPNCYGLSGGACRPGQLPNRLPNRSRVSAGKIAGGFTLVEMVVTLLLISILAVTVISKWPGRTFDVAAEGDRLNSYIRYAQTLAMTRGQRFRINLFADRYNITDLAGTPVPHPESGQTDVVLDSGITLSSSQSMIAFDGRGVPFINSAIPGMPLAADAVITLSAGSHSRTVRVSPNTGKVINQ